MKWKVVHRAVACYVTQGMLFKMQVTEGDKA